MYICICNAVTDRDIRKAVDEGARSLYEVQNRLPVGSSCGCCQDAAQEVVDEQLLTRSRCKAALICNVLKRATTKTAA